MSYFVDFGSLLIFLSLILLTESTDIKLDQTNTLGQTHYGSDRQNFWPILPSLNNIWDGLFYDGYYGDCGGNCRSGVGHIPLHHKPSIKPFKALRPLWDWDLFGNGYNYNYGVPNYSNNYGGGYQNHQESSYGKQDENYVSPQSPAPVNVNYEPTPPAYEGSRPTYEETDCANNKCGNVVFQPIIYVGPNSYDQKEISKDSSEEEETSEEPSSDNEEKYNEEANQTNEKEEYNSKEQYKSEKEERPSEEQYTEVEHKDSNEHDKNQIYTPQYIPSAKYIPQMPYYSQPPCAQPWSQMAVPLPVLTYMVPTPQNQYQMPFYNPPTNPVTYSQQPYATQSYQPCSACNNFGLTHNNAHIPPAPFSHATVPLTSTHDFSDPSYRTCPELFTNYRQQQSFKNYY